MVENSITSGFVSDFQESKDIISAFLISLGESWIKNHISDEYLERKLFDYNQQVKDLVALDSSEKYQKETLLNLIAVFSDSKNLLPSMLTVLEVDIKTDYILEQVYGIPEELFNLTE